MVGQIFDMFLDIDVRAVLPTIQVPTLAAEGEEASIAGCLIARLAGSGRCTHFREYWFDLEGHRQPFDGWGT
jgi:hypothetical protein